MKLTDETRNQITVTIDGNISSDFRHYVSSYTTSTGAVFTITGPLARALADHADKRHWHAGEPPKPQRDEWFIAETIYGDRVCLKALPEDWTYDYKTADETYIMARNVKRWMRFPDSHFIEPATAAMAIVRAMGGDA